MFSDDERSFIACLPCTRHYVQHSTHTVSLIPQNDPMRQVFIHSSNEEPQV